MTLQYFDARCYPGFIASYGRDSYWPEDSFFGHSEDFYKWLDIYCCGPVRFINTSTAHWETHTEFSHPDDVMLYKLTCRDNNVSTSVNCEETGPRIIDPKCYGNIYVGKNVDKPFLQGILDKYPYNVNLISERIFR